MADYVVGHLTRSDFARPTEHGWHPVGAFPIRVLFVAEWCHCRIRPTVHVRTVVCRVHDEGIVCDAQVVQSLKNAADVLVMVDHGIVVRALPSPRLSDALGLGMSLEVHMGEGHPYEKRFPGILLPLDEICRPVRYVVVNCHHPRFG